MKRLQEIRFFAELKRREWLSEAGIKKHQSRRLRKVLGGANKIPTYRDILAKAKIDPATAEPYMLARIPPIDKPAFRRLVATYTEDQTRADFHYWETSGSTGFPLKVPRTLKEARYSILMSTYFRFRSGIRWHEKIAKIGRRNRRMGRRTLPQKLGFGREYFIQMRQDENLIMDQLIEVDPHAIIAYPSHLHAVAHAFRERKRRCSPEFHQSINPLSVASSRLIPRIRPAPIFIIGRRRGPPDFRSRFRAP